MEAILETFRPVVGYEGIYEASDYGCVRSLHGRKVRYLKPHKNNKGYYIINLSFDGKKRHFLVHRLVYEAFNGPIPDGYEIDHVNTIHDDNRLANLRCVTRKENCNNPITKEHYIEASRRKAKDPEWIEAHREAMNKNVQKQSWVEAHTNAIRREHGRKIFQYDKNTGTVIQEWECIIDVEKELGIDNGHISACCRGKRKTAGGFKWAYKENTTR